MSVIDFIDNKRQIKRNEKSTLGNKVAVYNELINNLLPCPLYIGCFISSVIQKYVRELKKYVLLHKNNILLYINPVII